MSRFSAIIKYGLIIAENLASRSVEKAFLAKIVIKALCIHEVPISLFYQYSACAECQLGIYLFLYYTMYVHGWR
jgi:hypothetical protein